MHPLDFDRLLGAGFLSRSEFSAPLRGVGFNCLRFLPAGGGFWFAVARKPKSRKAVTVVIRKESLESFLTSQTIDRGSIAAAKEET